MRWFLRIVVALILIPGLYLVSVILYGTITDYKPAETEVVSKMQDEFPISDTSLYSALIFNIGYCGLGDSMDFFYDGGKKVRDSEDNTRRNLYEITNWLGENRFFDFIMLQEVDVDSRRTYGINEVENFNLSLADYFPFFALNYKCKFIPVPFTNPMGRVKSGLLTLSKYVPATSTRYSYPGNYAWPKSTFMLDRCFLVNRYKLNNGKYLLVINTHNSAYDDGTLRNQQKAYLKNFLSTEASKGNYILVGGDWNECPPGFVPAFNGQVFDTINDYYIDKEFMPKEWNWAYDNTQPTNRSVASAYDKGKTPVTLIDFYLSSPNIEIVRCKVIETDFKYSDHQPVFLQFRLKG
jgi:endonuclease/exonuclease/phosphatase family metal-dependent hydrolase